MYIHNQTNFYQSCINCSRNDGGREGKKGIDTRPSTSPKSKPKLIPKKVTRNSASGLSLKSHGPPTHPTTYIRSDPEFQEGVPSQGGQQREETGRTL